MDRPDYERLAYEARHKKRERDAFVEIQIDAMLYGTGIMIDGTRIPYSVVPERYYFQSNLQQSAAALEQRALQGGKVENGDAPSSEGYLGWLW